MSYRTWDTETTTTESFKRLGNPFDPDNWVVTHGFKKAGDKEPTEIRFGHQRPADGWFLPVIDGVKLLIGMNIKFDLLHAIYNQPVNLKAWMKWVADGGMIWDIQLAEYLLNGMMQKDHMLSLDEIAPRYGGTVKFDEVKALWAQGVRTEDIEPTLLSRYLCGRTVNGVREYGDVENTELVALAQIDRARRCGQLNSCLLNMGALISITEKERNGMYVDKAYGLELAAELEVEKARLEAELQTYLPADLPFEFNWGSRHHRSALIFGGQVPYDRREYRLKDDTFTFQAPDPDTRDLYAYPKLVKQMVRAAGTEDHYTLDHAKALNIPIERYEKGKKAGEPKLFKLEGQDYDKVKSRMGRDEFKFARITDPSRAWATSEPGVWSTSGDVIEELGIRNIPFLKALAALSKLNKDLGTYFIVTDDKGKQKGMLTLVTPEGIIHHKINQTSTVTGRFSSSDPNLQNVPTGKKSKIKQVFKSRWGKAGRIIQSDFKSLEIYVQAILTQCKQLIADLLDGLDMHVVRLAVKEKRPYAELLPLCKGYMGSDGVFVEPEKEWDYKRTGAKVFSFQRAYGAGVAKIAAETGMSEEDVQALVDADNERYPEIEPWYAKKTEAIKLTRKVFKSGVQHPFVPGVMCNLGVGTMRTPDGKLYSFVESPSPDYLVKRGVFQSFSPTEIKNYPVQGTGGEWAKAGEYLAVRAFYARENFGGLALLVNQVHDAQLADAHESVAVEAAALLHAAMEGASDYMEWAFKWPLPLPVPSDTTMGESWADDTNIPGLKDQAKPFREELRRLYMGGHRPSYIH